MHWRRPLVVDTALALAVAALTWGTMELERECQCPVRALAVVLVLAQSIPLAFRRLAPVPVWLVLGVVTGVHGGSTVQDPPVFFGALLAVYTVVSLSSRRTSIVVGIVTAVNIAVAVAASDDTRLQGRDTAPAPTFHRALSSVVMPRRRAPGPDLFLVPTRR